MERLSRKLQPRVEALLSVLDLPLEVVELGAPPSLDDLDQYVALTYTIAANGARYGDRLRFHRHSFQAMTDEQADLVAIDIARALAFGAGLAFRPDRKQISDAILAHHRYPKLPLWLALIAWKLHR